MASMSERVAILEERARRIDETLRKMDDNMLMLSREIHILKNNVGEIMGQQRMMDKVLKFVVVPLIMLIAAMNGAELVIP